jgi:hypothetical protein
MTRIVVLEVGRPIVEDVKSQIGEPTAVISYQRPIAEDEIPKIAGEVYRAVAKAALGGHEVHLVLSGPVALAFQIGQLIGLSHFNVVVYQFSGGKYRPIPPVTREMMFSRSEETSESPPQRG